MSEEVIVSDTKFITPNKLISEKLQTLIKNQDRYINSNGEILKSIVIDDAKNDDEKLIELLLSDNKIKETFFKNIKDALIFKKNDFISIVNSYEFMPNSYTKYCEKIGLVDRTGAFLADKKDVVLQFAHKDCYLEGGQTKEDQKYTEVFYNEVLAKDEIDRLLAPKAFCNVTKYSKEGAGDLFPLKKEHTSSFDIKKDNLLIKGNNLVALSCLKKQFSEQIKCIYIDIPYNTRRDDDSFGYNDKFNHSTWLVFMKNRLEIARELLKTEGVIFVQCDDNENSYIKVLLDEIFDRENYVNTISVNMKNVAGASGGGEDKKLKKNVEYIHIYAKNYDAMKRFNDIYEYQELYSLIENYKDKGKSWKYSEVMISPGEKEYIGSTQDGSGDEIKIYKRNNPVFKAVSALAKEEHVTEKEIYYNYIDKIYRTTMPQSSIRPRVMSKVKELGIKHDVYSIEYIPKTGEHAGQLYEQIYKGDKFNLVGWLKDVCVIKNNEILKENKQGTYWDIVGETKNLTKEGNVALPNGKKPEKLIYNILKMVTNEGDFVLDFFVGCGTTAAVAHKLNRRYIGIEQIDYGDNSALQRLINVLNGDTSAISKYDDVNGQGQGSFIYCELAQDENYKYLEKISNATDENINKIKEDIINNAIIRYEADDKKLKESWDENTGLSLEDKKDILKQLIDKNYMYVNYSEMNDSKYSYLSETDKAFTKSFYEGE